MSDITHLIRKDLKHFSPYSSARHENKEGSVWLNANELPWDDHFAPFVHAMNRYPQQQPDRLISALANFYKISENQLVVTRGSDEAIDLLLRLFCQPQKDDILICSPTFGMYEVYAVLQGVKIHNIPLVKEKEFQLNMQKLQNDIRKIKMVFLCSPNNPTGNIINKDDIMALCEMTRHHCFIVIDEAYIEFTSTGSLVHLIEKYPHVIILRTLSKAFGLAAIRIGCLLGNQQLVSWVKKILPPYPIPQPSIEIAMQKVTKKNMVQMNQRIEIIISERQKMYVFLKTLSVIKKVWPSEANFLLIECEQEIHPFFLNDGIVIRYLRSMNYAYMYRISIGTPEENTLVIKQFQLLEKKYGSTI